MARTMNSIATMITTPNRLSSLSSFINGSIIRPPVLRLILREPARLWVGTPRDKSTSREEVGLPYARHLKE
ncbi:MAG: hypothetical protein WC494_00860 [Candidatus Pacearchaeota archaeon]